MEKDTKASNKSTQPESLEGNPNQTPPKNTQKATAKGSTDEDTPNPSDDTSGMPGGGGRSPLRRILSFSRLYLVMFVLLLVISAMAVFLTASLSKKNAANPTPKATSLTSGQISQIQGNTTLVGDPKQTLDIQGNAIFEGQGLYRNDLAVATALKVGGALSAQSLNIGGTGNFNQLQVNQNLTVNGDFTVSGGLTIQKNLAVNGSGSFSGGLTVSTLSANSLQLNNDLTVNQHLISNGSIPGISGGGALGAGGTASLSGSDTAGTITINVGAGPAAGTLATINFAKKFSKTPHVVVAPAGSAGANLQYYVSRSTGSFSLSTLNAPTAGTSFSFDYIVID